MESIVSAGAIIWNLEDKLCVITTGKNKDSRKLWGSFIQKQMFWQEE